MNIDDLVFIVDNTILEDNKNYKKILPKAQHAISVYTVKNKNYICIFKFNMNDKYFTKSKNMDRIISMIDNLFI